MNERRQSQTDLPKQGDLKATESSNVTSEVGASHKDYLVSDVDLHQVTKNFLGHKETSKYVAMGYSYTEKEQLAKTEDSSEKKDLTRHQTSVLSLNCRNCDYVGETMEEYVSHRRNVHNCVVFGIPCEKKKKVRPPRQPIIGIFTCDLCGKIFNQQYKLKNHTKRLNGKCVNKSVIPQPCYIVQPLVPMNKAGGDEKPETPKVLKCPNCDYIGKTMHQYKAHWSYIHGIGSNIIGCFKCPICNKTFDLKKKMKQHLARHSETGSFPCKVCGIIYADKSSLRRHNMTHKEGWTRKTFSCNHCNKVLLNKSSLKYHVDKVHLQSGGNLLCSICGKRYRSKTCLQEHVNAHLKIKPLSCKICGKAFSYSASLSSHKLVHMEERPFVCPVCSYSFRTKRALFLHHERIHKKIIKFRCSVCGKGFCEKYNLIRHARVHTGDKPFVCEICEKRFNDYTLIRRHMIFVHKEDPKHWRVKTRTEKARKSFLSQTLTIVSETN